MVYSTEDMTMTRFDCKGNHELVPVRDGSSVRRCLWCSAWRYKGEPIVEIPA